MAKLFFAVAFTMFLLVSYANAGQTGNYVGLSSGVLLTRNNNISDQTGSNASLEYDSLGIPVSALIGHQFGVGLRVEGELYYKRATINKFSYSGATSKVDSATTSVGAMGNLYYDWYHNLSEMKNDVISPYIGVGAGFAEVNMSSGSVSGYKLWNSGNDFVPAYQVIIGNCNQISERTFLDISYRYFAASRISVDTIKTSYNNQDIMVGIKYLFK